MRKFLLIIGILIFFCTLYAVPCTLANNIQVANVSLQNTNAGAGTVEIKFDLTWENSYSGTDANSQAFFDRAWVFVKFWKTGWATDGTVAWAHATLTSGGSVTAYDTATGMGVITSDGKGAFCKPGINQTVKWNLTADSINPATDTVQVKVMAIEMVYIPTGTFYVGSGSTTESGSFTNGSWTSGATIPLQIASEGAITIGTSATNLWGTSTSGNNTIGGAGTLSDNSSGTGFPKGYHAFYIMKYELSQGQYRDFLNLLSRAQQNGRTASQAASQYVMSNTTTVSNRNGIRAPASIPSGAITFGCDLNGNGTFNEVDDGEFIACDYLAWQDLCAYADWAGLRPMTELEFEKACRGGSPTNNAFANEYAWGTATIAASAYTLSNSGLNNEGIATNYATAANTGNCIYNVTYNVAPVRCGIFAANASNTGRVTSGASYYGVMELSGNLWERCVSVGRTNGRAFTGLHGDGVLTSAGDANTTNWYSTDATGSGFRGGNWGSGATDARVSGRDLAAITSTTRDNNDGGRLARTSP